MCIHCLQSMMKAPKSLCMGMGMGSRNLVADGAVVRGGFAGRCFGITC